MAVFYPKALAVLKVVFESTRGDEEGGRSLVVQARPKSFTVHRNSYKSADEFDLEFEASVLPFSPDIIRSMGVEIYGYASDELYPSPESEARALVPANRLIVGLVDEPEIHLDGGGRWFRVSGRDYTGILLDRQWDPAKPVKPRGTLANTVQYLADVGSGVLDENGKATGLHRVLTVRVADGVSPPAVGSALGKTNKKGVPVKGGNFWDVIYSYVLRHGLIVYVDGTDVVIDHPNNLTDSTKATAVHVAYGRNLTSLSVNRKLGKETVPPIEVVSYDPKTRKSIRATWPTNPNQKTTAIGTKKDETQVITVMGVTSKDRLLEIAKLRYAALARSEAAYRFETRELQDLDGRNVLNLKFGQPIRVDWDDINAEDFHALNSAAARRAAMVKLGYHPDVAKEAADAYDVIARERAFFYTMENSISYDASAGYAFEITAANYIRPSRDDVR